MWRRPHSKAVKYLQPSDQLLLGALLPCCHSLRKQRLTADTGPAYDALADDAALRGMS